jgi:hypothetical protein
MLWYSILSFRSCGILARLIKYTFENAKDLLPTSCLAFSLALKMETVYFPEILADFCRTTQDYAPGNNNVCSHHCARLMQQVCLWCRSSWEENCLLLISEWSATEGMSGGLLTMMVCCQRFGIARGKIHSRSSQSKIMCLFCELRPPAVIYTRKYNVYTYTICDFHKSFLGLGHTWRKQNIINTVLSENLRRIMSSHKFQLSIHNIRLGSIYCHLAGH